MKKFTRVIFSLIISILFTLSTVSVASGADVDTTATNKDGCDGRPEVVWNADGSLVVVAGEEEHLVGFRFGDDFYPAKDDKETKLGPAIAREETEDATVTYLDSYKFIEDAGTDIAPLLKYLGKLWNCGAVKNVFPEGWTYHTTEASEESTSGIEVNLQQKEMTFVGIDLAEMLEKGITTLRLVADMEGNSRAQKGPARWPLLHISKQGEKVK